MNFIITIFILLGLTFSGFSQTRCFTYDAAGNRTSRVSCTISIQQDDDGELSSQVVTSVANDVGGSLATVREQLLSNDISPLVIYPNPSLGVFHINATLDKSARLMIYDSSGNTVWTRDSVPDQIDVMHLDNGTYYMVISEPNGVRSALVIISK
jgi:YD repeat-containing protein